MHYKGISFFGSSLSVLSLVRVRLPRRFYYYLLMIPAIRHLELSTVTVDDSYTLPTLGSFIQSSIYSLNPLPKENEDVPRTIPKHLYTLTLESLRVHNLDISLLAQLLTATRKDTLLEVCMESPCQDSRIINEVLSLHHITSLTLSWETREVHFPVMLFPRLQYLDVLHSHVGAFLRRGHRVKTLKLKEFEPSTLERLPMNGLPISAPDLGSILSPSSALNSALEPTFNGIKTLHISIYGINRDVRVPDPYVHNRILTNIIVAWSSCLSCYMLPTRQRLLHQSRPSRPDRGLERRRGLECRRRVPILNRPTESVPRWYYWNIGATTLFLYVSR